METTIENIFKLMRGFIYQNSSQSFNLLNPIQQKFIIDHNERLVRIFNNNSSRHNIKFEITSLHSTFSDGIGSKNCYVILSEIKFNIDKNIIKKCNEYFKVNLVNPSIGVKICFSFRTFDIQKKKCNITLAFADSLDNSISFDIESRKTNDKDLFTRLFHEISHLYKIEEKNVSNVENLLYDKYHVELNNELQEFKTILNEKITDFINTIKDIFEISFIDEINENAERLIHTYNFPIKTFPVDCVGHRLC